VQHQFPGGAGAGSEGDRAGGGAVEQGVVHQGGEALLQAVGVAAGMIAGQIEQVGDERAHPLGLLLDQLQCGGLGTAAQQALGMAGDQGDRRAPFLVAD
jgi:hypothetical protein